MTCQYHGWEYGEDGRTRKIREPKNFAPFDRDVDRLDRYRVATCGGLVFVCLVESGPSLEEQLGDVYDRLAERFGAAWRPYLKWDPQYSANWKVPIENTLEAYHVPQVHPHTFREDPGSQRSTHVLDERHTWFGADLPFSPHSKIDTYFQRGEAWLMRRLGETPQGRYEQHHIFPTLLCSFTDVISLVQSVLPTGPRRRAAVWACRRANRISLAVDRRILGTLGSRNQPPHPGGRHAHVRFNSARPRCQRESRRARRL
jgi:phenylpropionate dioxygenase-like ring-hydroxylating dioxygenase large terminal subunit